MEIAIYGGAHATNQDALIQSLVRNRETLAEHGAVVPRPRTYRDTLRDTLTTFMRGMTVEDAGDVFLDLIMGDSDAERVVIAFQHLLGAQPRALEEGRLYPHAAGNLEALLRMFEGHEVELIFAIRNLETTLPALYQHSRAPSFESYLSKTDPLRLRWSDMFMEIRNAHPNLQITTWCYESAPILWDRIICETAVLPAGTEIEDRDAPLREAMTDEGVEAYLQYQRETPDVPNAEWREITDAFFTRYAKPAKNVASATIPGMTPQMSVDLAAAYQEDIDTIRQIPGVRLIE